MPMRRSTREFQFINTSHPDERTFLLKKFDKLKELPDNLPDIESDNLIKRYQRRPKKSEKLCLAEFAAWFNCVSDKHADSASDKAFATGPDGFMPETNLEDNTDDDVPITEDVNEQESDTNQYHMRGGINLIKRKRPKIIRSVRFNREKDPENFFTEQLMLFTPWRKEDIDLQGDSQSFEERFEQLSDSILCNREPYEYHSEMLDKALADIIVEQGDNIGDNVAPNSENINEQDRAIKEKPSELFGCFDPGKNKQHNQYDLLDDIGIFPRCNDQEELVVKRVSDF
ncbi:uncharacterized protein LOC116619447 [Nematostella vectensis]|uniref:uncharacterized protein LOC116619447 n=1 Tax=Nematostella vectensis TaxID=45351 RepID=UPI00207759F1|nr:uncharacterized protein LOC116619447 [Nematostella vectensis]